MIENFAPPWYEHDVSGLLSMINPNLEQPEPQYLEPPPPFEVLVSNVVTKILVEKGLIS